MKVPYPSLAGLVLAVGVLPLGSVQAVVIDYVPVGNPNNPNDSTGYGAVAYEYRIGKYEVTNAEYAAFLNAVAQTDDYGLYNSGMSSNARGGITQAGESGNYWQYPTQSDSIPTVGTAGVNGDISNPGANVANYLSGADWDGEDGHLTTVGSAMSDSYYGTFDQGGNVWEWNDAIANPSRGMRGGSFPNREGFLRAAARNFFQPSLEIFNVGFRVASVPEPGVTVLGLLASGLLLRRRRG